MDESKNYKYNVHYPSLAAAGLAFLIGLMTQLFIVVVNIMDWVKGRPKSPVDQILTSLGITRICLHSFSFFNAMCVIFLRRYIQNMKIFLELIVNSSNLSDIWLGTLFSIIFCMKICNFHNAAFLYFRTLVSQKVSYLMLASVLVSICFISMFLITDEIIIPKVFPPNFTSNETQIPVLIHVYIFITMGNSMPFLIYCTSSLFLIASLCLHLNRMKTNSNVSTNLDSYYKAIQFMAVCLISYVFRIGTNLLVLRLYYSLDILWLFIIWNSVAILNSMYLIYRTNKLSNQFSKILRHGTNYMFNRRDSVTNYGDQEETATTTM
ncbi:hypothetical protein GDO78_014033 [Eleutherodactylus coqui]|uniref:Taste receptor type 2 n=1 Tax=Eleutherodactylus coqui TaxID=57060 RepID=A0A8J6EEY3_ELECQ|nr:hypothetical protein GDO78_014033 [Eleutherodactylus coqui]